METYRSGHNGAHSKCVSLNRLVGSNPTVSAKENRNRKGCGFRFVKKTTVFLVFFSYTRYNDSIKQRRSYYETRFRILHRSAH